MELQFDQRDCQFLRCNMRQVQNLEQTQEVRLPEGMPDIGRVLCAWGQGMLRSKEWRGDSITVSGSMQVWVLYAPEDGSEPRSVEVSLPFAGKWNLPESKREGVILANLQICHVDARTISARKMMVRGTVGVQAQALESAQEAVYVPDSAPETLQILKRTYPAVLAKEAGEKQFLVDEDLTLDGVPRKILACQVQPVVTEQTAAGGRAVFRGDCRVHLVYMDEDDQLRSEDISLPFAQLAELDRDYDKEASAQVTMVVTNMDAGLMDGTAHLQCGLVGQYVVSDREMLTVAEDAYSPYMEILPAMEALCLPMLLERRQEALNLEAEMPIPASRLLDVQWCMMQPTVYREEDLAIVEVPGCVQVLYADEEGNLACDSQNCSARTQLPAGHNCTVTAELIQTQPISALLMGDKVRYEAGVTVSLTSTAKQELPMLTSVTIGERGKQDPNRPTLILQRMGDAGLWELAKACGSTVEAIEKANQLQAEPQRGQLLLIPVL